MFGAAQHTIRLSLQDLGFRLGGFAAAIWPEALLRQLADLLVVKHGEVFIVLSEPGSVSVGDNSYSTGVSLEEVARKIRAVVRAHYPMPEAELDALLCRNLHLAPLRFGDEDAWPEGYKMADHAKLWIIDDRAFHIGSHNLYPVDLQEFGFIVEAREPTRQLLRDYWEPLWYQSSVAAISGEEAFRCILRER
jgi:hypothetical protein